MMIGDEIAELASTNFVGLILDNEVTVGEFVVDPPLPWLRLIQERGEFRVGSDYPCSLTAARARFEMRNWDEVSLPTIIRALPELAMRVDYLVLGNNAGQGLPLASSVPRQRAGTRAAIIYASSLPEEDAYRQLGYRSFWRRRDTAAELLRHARLAERPLALCFINTVQHNESNYHDP